MAECKHDLDERWCKICKLQMMRDFYRVFVVSGRVTLHPDQCPQCQGGFGKWYKYEPKTCEWNPSEGEAGLALSNAVELLLDYENGNCGYRRHRVNVCRCLWCKKHRPTLPQKVAALTRSVINAIDVDAVDVAV
jgi:hypothetical protein